ncbi:MAG TPA: hypothetical protein VF787_27640 [Thermoanaerobaculia bacterium]
MLITRPATHHADTPLKIAILSGLSDPSTCALSDMQRDFLQRLDAPHSAKVFRNFPYVDSATPRRNPGLLIASWRNTQQFLNASNAKTIEHARRHWRALRDSTDALLIITLSCGLEILRHCVGKNEGAVHVLALGPVARALPALPCTLVRGSRDPISRVFFNDALVLPNLGHLDYFTSTAVLEIANELCSSILNSSAADSISRNSA